MDQKPRQAATPFAIGRRIQDAGLHRLRDGRRSDGHRKHSLPAVMSAVVLGLSSNCTSLRGVEALTHVLSSTVRRMFSLRGRISDTTLSEGLENVCPAELHRCMVRMVLAEHRRGNLRPTADLPGSVVALDGKHQATLSHSDLLRLARRISADRGRVWDAEAIRRVVTGAFPNVQVCIDERGQCRGLMRYHRVTLTSAPSHPCLWLEPIPGDTNEVGHAVATIRAMLRAYAGTRLIDIITADAGNTSAAVAREIDAAGKRYLLALKRNQPEAEAEAHRLLDHAEPDHVSTIEKVRGQRVCHRIYLADVTGSLLNIPSARSLVRVRRTVTRPDGAALSDDNRYFVSNIDLQSTTARSTMALVRSHWRCENNGHWTSDAILGEDRRRVRFARTPHRIAATAICRMIAQNILGLLRSLSRTPGSGTRPSWRDTIFHTIRALTGAVRHRSIFEVAVFP